ncbi:crossover junction endonuclease MUS81 isoform X2 [Ornithorhynchus anatinus]|uniref:crossover junction endonuclease MUS81 isoform X2 n=1 Tax=Ornithorhynchus anatinus TaxID=9258 RepID=UPI0010A9364B|nr:crossover junction endonuclease MUS81 isoform X2 [Ornithorhynchus anatinus]
MAAAARPVRKRPVPACPNPLFVRWLTEWRDEAASRGRRTQFVYHKALRSLQKYPLPLRSGKEAKILQHFGDGICRQLDARLQRHRAAGEEDEGPGPPEGEKSDPGGSAPRPGGGPRPPSLPGPAQGKARGAGSYRPPRRSGPYVLLLLMYREQRRPSGLSFLSREELQQRCERESPGVVPSRSTGPWPALRSLLRRNLVLRTHRPDRYSLTAEGLELAQKLVEAEGQTESEPGVPSPHSGQEEEPPDGASIELDPGGRDREAAVELRAGGYEIVLCVDVSETTGGTSRPELLQELQSLRVPHVVRKLHVGDFVWTARGRGSGEPSHPTELVLDHIVERKRLDDLCSSIIDGRFREQKFRLKRCGLRRCIYLVEDHGSAQNLSLPETTLLQAITNTQVIDGFFVKRTVDLKESAAYLALLTRGLQRLYEGQTLHSRPWGKEEEDQARGDTPAPTPHPQCSFLTFRDFNAGAMKNKAQSVREVFARQLMQVRGVSGEKAAALLDRYSTPASLLAAYDACATPQEREGLLSTIKCGPLKRSVAAC